MSHRNGSFDRALVAEPGLYPAWLESPLSEG